jgi:hypothetical protein
MCRVVRLTRVVPSSAVSNAVCPRIMRPALALHQCAIYRPGGFDPTPQSPAPGACSAGACVSTAPTLNDGFEARLATGTADVHIVTA